MGSSRGDGGIGGEKRPCEVWIAVNEAPDDGVKWDGGRVVHGVGECVVYVGDDGRKSRRVRVGDRSEEGRDSRRCADRVIPCRPSRAQ